MLFRKQIPKAIRFWQSLLALELQEKLKYYPFNTQRLWRIKCGMNSEFYYQIQYLFFFCFVKVAKQVGMAHKNCDFNILSCICVNEGIS